MFLIIYYLHVSHLCTILYADDTSVLVNDKKIDKLLEILNYELNKLSTWLKASILNVNKTHNLFHGARIKPSYASLNVYMNNNTLTQIECCKYLGVILDSKMAWVQQITCFKYKISKCLGIMYQARKYLV